VFFPPVAKSREAAARVDATRLLQGLQGMEASLAGKAETIGALASRCFIRGDSRFG
jgi:hypothetical protein